MAISTDYRKKDVQKNVEKQLASVTAAYLRGYVKLAKGSGTMEVNPNVEIAAWDGEHFLRYYGTADLTKNEAVVEKAFELMPEIAEAYKSNGWEMGVFFLNNATAEIRNMMEIEESYEFKY